MSTTLNMNQTGDTRRVEVPRGKDRRSLFALLRYSRDIDRRLAEEQRLTNELLEDLRAMNRR